MKREEYIKNIISALAEIQAQVGLNNNICLYDINHMAEDFFCGLLNLVYGYKLKNLNHIEKNAKAIDLYDEKNRVSVQVTVQNTAAKIQETIDKFISGERYKKYDRLFFVLLKDKESYNKNFITNGKFEFDKGTDILDIKDFMAEIQKLDTAALKKINVYMTEEIGKRRYRPKSFWACAVILLAFTALAILTMKDSRSAKVEFSEILPFEDAGYYENYDDLPAIEKTKIETWKAFSLLSFVYSDGDKPSVVEKVSCEIQNLEPIHKPSVSLDADIVDNTLKVFAFNDGWGDADALAITSAVVHDYNSSEDLESICQNVHFESNHGLRSSKAVLLAEYALDGAKFQELCAANGGPLYSIEIKINDDMAYSIGFLKYKDGKFYLEYGGMGGHTPSMTLFAVLDVDKRPSAINFTVRNEPNIVNDILRIETVIAPTKSCTVTCKNVFCINGKKYATTEYTAEVYVPVFTDSAIGFTGALTKELAQLDKFDEYQANILIEKYLYNPESIRDIYLSE
ncbi:MAG: SMEK domain-containing protein [Lachnospiraceae bacterium]|nr:SMEK domain-containing protein [Lachnospiraceae bacterium]